MPDEGASCGFALFAGGLRKRSSHVEPAAQLVIVLSDTTPINYLVLTGFAEILPALFDEIVIPTAVQSELLHARTPDAVRQWIGQPPAWLSIRGARTHRANFVGAWRSRSD